MTAVQEHATLTVVDDEVRAALEEAADAVINGPKRLRQAIRRAADTGEKPAAITRAIHHAYTYDYVARIVRKHRAGEADPDAEPPKAAAEV